MRTLLVPALLLAGCGTPPRTAPDSAPPAPDAGALPADLGPDLAPIRAANGVPALAAAVASSDGVIAIGAVGTRHRDTDVAIELDDRWHLGSDTKAMTATLIAIAVEEGRLSWDTTLAEALPAIDAMHADYRDVPIDGLLAHRAGAWTDLLAHWDVIEGLPADAPLDEQRAIFAETMLESPPELAPGTAFAYSNAGYMVAGAILEEIYGAPWEQLIAERLFEPLGMASCGFGAPGTTAALDEPWGHWGDAMTPIEPDSEASDNPPVLGPAGTVHCSLPDWARFARLHLGAGPALVSAASLARLHTPLGDGYALGWLVGTHPEHGDYLAHDGSNTLWYARIVILPDRDRIVLIAVNAATAGAVAAVDATTELLL